MDNISKLFEANIKVNDCSCMNEDAIWPNNIEVCICRVPIRKVDGYSEEFMKNFSSKLKNHMAPNGIAFLIVYAPIEDKSRPFEVAKSMTEAGFTHIDNIIVQKSWFPGKRSETTLVNSHEFVFHFCNGNVWTLDRQPIREYLKTPEEQSCPGNTWTVETGSLDDSYSYELADLLIRMTDCLPGSLLFDPFMKSSAALKVALKYGHNFIGYETENSRIEKYRKIINKYIKERQTKEIARYVV